MSPDNFVQDPSNTQNYYRYGYVLNNPLKYIDSSGENAEGGEEGDGILGWVIGGVVSLAGSIKSVWNESWAVEARSDASNFIGRNGQSFVNDLNNLANWGNKNLDSLVNDVKNFFGFGDQPAKPPLPTYQVNAPAQIGMFDTRTSSMAVNYGNSISERISNSKLWKHLGSEILFGHDDPNMITADISNNPASMLIGGGPSIKGLLNLKNVFKVEQYSLRAIESGFYPVMERGFAKAQELVWLEKDEIWKFGTTRHPFTRYTQKYLKNRGEKGLYYFREFEGTLSEALKLEKMKIMNFFEQNGFLPWGNKIAK